jgi:hypothetical protein
MKRLIFAVLLIQCIAGCDLKEGPEFSDCSTVYDSNTSSDTTTINNTNNSLAVCYYKGFIEINVILQDSFLNKRGIDSSLLYSTQVFLDTLKIPYEIMSIRISPKENIKEYRPLLLAKFNKVYPRSNFVYSFNVEGFTVEEKKSLHRTRD